MDIITYRALKNDIDGINELIPSSTSSSNQLADKAFVDTQVDSLAAYYITKNANGDPFATVTELTSATTFYSGGVVRVPTRNDYCIVLADENHDNATTRYIYTAQWEYQYTVDNLSGVLPEVTAGDNGKILTVVEGKWDKADAPESGISQDDADNRYFKLSGGDLSGNINMPANGKISFNNTELITAVGNSNITVGNFDKSNLLLRTNNAYSIVHSTPSGNSTVLDTYNTVANPVLQGDEQELTSLTLNNRKYKISAGDSLSNIVYLTTLGTDRFVPHDSTSTLDYGYIRLGDFIADVF